MMLKKLIVFILLLTFDIEIGIYHCHIDHDKLGNIPVVIQLIER